MRRAAPLLVSLALAASTACATATRRPDGQVGLLPVGSMAPDLEAADAAGTVTKLSSLRGRPVVVYFYPRDGTPGCTREACAFRDAWARFDAAHVVVIGVSSQSRESHAAFEKEHGLPFPLVADEHGDAQVAYGVPRSLVGDARVSFLVSPEGKIARVWPDVDPAVHAEEVLTAATAIAR